MASQNREPPHTPYHRTHVPGIANVVLIGRDAPAQGVQTRPMTFIDVSPHLCYSHFAHLPSSTNVALTGRDAPAQGVQTRRMPIIDVSHLRRYCPPDAPVSANGILMANVQAPPIDAETIDSPAYRRYRPTHATISANGALSARDTPTGIPQSEWIDSLNPRDHCHPTNGNISIHDALSARDATSIHSELPPYSLDPLGDFATEFTDNDEQFTRLLKEWCTDEVFEFEGVASDLL